MTRPRTRIATLALLAGLVLAALRATGAVYVPPAPAHAKEFAFVHADGVFHLFYMRLFPDSTAEVNLTSFGHAVSTDLHTWTELDTLLAVRPGEWDSDHVWSPSLIYRDGTWYMFYTGVKNVPYGWQWFQRIGVATSTDLVNWTRYPEPVFSGAQVPWAYSDSSEFDGCQFRDAFVMPDPADTTRWLMYYVTTPAEARGQLIAAVARNDGGLAPWTDLMPLWCTDEAHFWGWSESPVLLEHEDQWFMFMTTNSTHTIRYRTTPDPTADSTLWSGTYRLFDNVGQDSLSDQWFGPEVLSVNGQDFLAYVDGTDLTIGIQEIHWAVPATDFTLADPVVLAAPRPAARGAVELGALGRPGAGRHVAFRMHVPAATTGRLELFDLAGRRVAAVRSGAMPAGDSFAEWNGRADSGAGVANGVYFARLATPLGTRTLRIAVAE